MDGDNGLNIRNWGYYEPATTFNKSHLALQLMSSMPEKPLIGGRNAAVLSGTNGPFHHRDIGMSQGSYPMEYMRDAWISSQRDKYMNMIPTNHNYGGIPETSSAHQMQMIPPPELPKEESPVEEAPVVEKANSGTRKKRQGPKVPKSPKAKKPKKAPRAPKDENAPSVQRARVPKKTTEIVINGMDMDISSIPIPVCSCTGSPQQCYRWGSGGWQSACCTTGISVYPLPMSTKRRGARIAGRKMSIGAFKKVLEKLAAEGYNFSNPIDLRTYWAKHGTNKFVTIREMEGWDPNTKSTLTQIPLLATKAGPRDGAAWTQRLKEEYKSLITYMQMNKSNDNDWFRISAANPEGTRWTGKCWYVYNLLKYEFDLQFDIPVTYPSTAPELELPQLDGKTQKMYRGGKICLTVHFKPLWAKNCPRFGIAHALCLGLAPWLAAEIPILVDTGMIKHKDDATTSTES